MYTYLFTVYKPDLENSAKRMYYLLVTKKGFDVNENSEGFVPNGGINPPQKERENHQGIEVWIVDDYIDISDTIKAYLDRDGMKTVCFEKAKDAFAEIERRIESSEKQPDIILVDGSLAKDEGGPWQLGGHFIAKLRGLNLPNTPLLVAHSTSSDSNARMNGDAAIVKGKEQLNDYSGTLKDLFTRNQQT